MPDSPPPPLAWQGSTVESMQSGWSEGAGMEVMHPYRYFEVIPEVKGVQAFPPVFFNNNPMKRKEKPKWDLTFI